ncbi:MAG: helix-turn-helix transcriptional regulator [Chloroflexaceae bacterium]|nr:helix-turn-helix transcriptional regulator [Chloroflexaceae bacterium]
MRLFEGELTEREEEILAGIAQHKTNQEIADELCISVHTVHYHQKNIFCKLEVSLLQNVTTYPCQSFFYLRFNIMHFGNRLNHKFIYPLVLVLIAFALLLLTPALRPTWYCDIQLYLATDGKRMLCGSPFRELYTGSCTNNSSIVYFDYRPVEFC